MNFKTLYSKTAIGQTQQWEIFVTAERRPNGKVGYYTTEGIVGGTLTTSAISVCEGKNIGRANETSAYDQAIKEAEAKYKKKLKTGYSENLDNAGEKSYVQCMLAEKYNDFKDRVKYPIIINWKLNGTRLIATKQGLFTRKGERYYMDSVPHIWEQLKPFFDEHPNAVLDGEVFNDALKERLNELNSICATKKKEKITPAFLVKSKDICQYHIYDGYGFNETTESTPYLKRISLIEDLFSRRLKTESIHVIQTKTAKTEEELFKAFDAYVAQGGEGLIIRSANMPYEHKRSKNLLKLKPEDDTEMRIEAIHEGTGDWAGKAKSITVRDVDGNIKKDMVFDVSFKGSMPQAIQFLADAKKYIGKKLTIKYNGLTGLGTPQFAQLDYNNCLSSDK